MSISLQPAYGRDYKSAKAAKESFDTDHDFIIIAYNHPMHCSNGQPINRPQLIADGVKEVIIRYKQCTMVTTHRVV